MTARRVILDSKLQQLRFVPHAKIAAFVLEPSVVCFKIYSFSVSYV